MATFTKKSLSGSINGQGIELNNHDTYADGGILWSTISSPSLNNVYVVSLGYAKDYFITAENNSAVSYKSTNGITWTNVSGLPGGQGAGSTRVKEVNKIAFIVGNSGVFSFSTDTVTWTTSSTSGGSGNIYGISYAKILNQDVYLIGSESGMHRSTNLINWVTTSSSIASVTPSGSLEYFNNRFIAIGTGTRQLKISTNGTNWTTTTLSGSATSIYGPFIGQNKLLVSDNANNIHISTDAINWTAYSRGISQPQKIVFGKNKWVSNSGFSSTDGVSWSNGLSVSGKTTDSTTQSLTFGNDRFVWLNSNYDNTGGFSIDKKPQIIHNSSANPSSQLEEIWLYGVNNNSSAKIINIKVSSNNYVEKDIEITLGSNSGLIPILPGTILKDDENVRCIMLKYICIYI
jgi:hypothetical protein